MVLVPLFALDQYAMARRLEAVGAGIALQNGSAEPARLRLALQQLLTDGAHGNAARRVANEIAQLPHLSATVAPLERLANQSA
jgi:UDP:flavonoid glycosyltransferase YjiC (YdhE family)